MTTNRTASLCERCNNSASLVIECRSLALHRNVNRSYRGIKTLHSLYLSIECYKVVRFLFGRDTYFFCLDTLTIYPIFSRLFLLVFIACLPIPILCANSISVKEGSF